MIIESLLDTDLYKFTMQQVVLHRFPDTHAQFDFKNRTETTDLTPYIGEIEQELDYLCSLKFTSEELEYLRSLRFIKPDYVEFLKLFHLDRRFIKVRQEDGIVTIVIRGPWLHTILFEVPVLAIVNEVYFRNQGYDIAELEHEGQRRLEEKIQLSKTESGFKIADFGTRRRFSRAWQGKIIQKLAQELPGNLIGTSNVLFARKNGLKPIGTMAHEFVQAAQAMNVRLQDSQKFALEGWVQEYRGDLGIALSDTVGFDAFLRDFDLYFMKLFDGARQDSGDPFQWTDMLIAHYEKHGIDPRTKTAVFSDGLSFPRALELYRTYKNKIRCSFGIGTNLTNDLGPKALQIVIKLTQCNGLPVAKISDSPGKGMCKDEEFLKYLKKVFLITN